MVRRQTVQKELVLSAVRTLGCHPTADEVYSHIIKVRPSVSRGTVYRNLNVLSEEGMLLRIPMSGGPDRFDHNTGFHSHAVCRGCGAVYDVKTLPPNCFDNLLPPGFTPTETEIVINGTCKNCASR